MSALPALNDQGIVVTIGLPNQDKLLEAMTRLALGGGVHVIVGGNRFDGHQLARVVRGHTIYVNKTLARIHLARPFTCYQLIALLQQTEMTTPFVVLDMLTTFYDENISDVEAVRLLTTAVTHLQHLSRQAPVLITLRHSPTPTRSNLTKIVCNAADQVIHYEPAAKAEQRSFW